MTVGFRQIGVLPFGRHVRGLGIADRRRRLLFSVKTRSLLILPSAVLRLFAALWLFEYNA
jgi:hypothetical protein